MKTNNSIIKNGCVTVLFFVFSISNLVAQNDTLYIMKQGTVWGKFRISEIDSMIFYQPQISPNITIDITTVDIPAGTFTMGSPITEVNRATTEIEHQVTLSAFRMSKYEITNTQYADFLNAINIGSDGLYAGGAYPTEALVYENSWGLQYVVNQWIPASGYENHPVVNVSWYGATEFASYVGGTLPTEAQWEYAARGGTSTAFNTGTCLSDTQANYNWEFPQSGCSNVNPSYPNTTQVVGSYAANAFGLHDMHGNVIEFCSDFYGPYTTTPQTDPTGPLTGSDRVLRGGAWSNKAELCRSAHRLNAPPEIHSSGFGFRIVLPQ